MDPTDDLRQGLAAYDGRSPTILSELGTRHRNRPAFLSDLVTFAADETELICEAATWMLKVELEHGQSLTPQDIERLIRNLGHVTAWQAQLHICQSLRHISVPEAQAATLADWLSALLDAKRPFLRAWAVDALCRLWGRSAKTTVLLARMQSDAAASVRARVRNLSREFDVP